MLSKRFGACREIPPCVRRQLKKRPEEPSKRPFEVAPNPRNSSRANVDTNQGACDCRSNTLSRSSNLVRRFPLGKNPGLCILRQLRDSARNLFKNGVPM
jgi:hypothetical protein